jgi:hypothetical protein
MAEIDVHRKGPTIWVWVVGGLFALLILIALIALGTRGTDPADPPTLGRDLPLTGPYQPIPVENLPMAARQFEVFAERWDAQRDAAIQHAWVLDGVGRLTSALGAIALREGIDTPEVQQRLEDLRQRAPRLHGADPLAAEHPGLVRETFAAVTDAMAGIQQARFPALSGQVAGVREAGESIDLGRPLVEQAERVSAFFQRANVVLQGMIGSTPHLG